MNLQDLKNIPISLAITPIALSQIKLMKEHDYTLRDQFLRIVIKGKGCNGFTYSVQFSNPQVEDVQISVHNQVDVLLDSFTAQFVRVGILDFVQTHVEEGFVFSNNYEHLFQGKFFKDLKF